MNSLYDITFRKAVTLLSKEEYDELFELRESLRKEFELLRTFAWSDRGSPEWKALEMRNRQNKKIFNELSERLLDQWTFSFIGRFTWVGEMCYAEKIRQQLIYDDEYLMSTDEVGKLIQVLIQEKVFKDKDVELSIIGALKQTLEDRTIQVYVYEKILD